MKQININCTDTQGNIHLIHVNINDVDSKTILAVIADRLYHLTRTPSRVKTDAAGVTTTFIVDTPLTDLTIKIMTYFFSDPLAYRKFHIIATHRRATIEPGLSSVLFSHTLRLESQDVGYTINGIWDTDALDTTFFKPLENKDSYIHVYQDEIDLYEGLVHLISECTTAYRHARLRHVLKTHTYESIPLAYLELIDKSLDSITTCTFPIKQDTLYTGHDEVYGFEVYTKIFQDYLTQHEDHQIYLFYNKDHFYFIFSHQAKQALIKQHIDEKYSEQLFFGGLTKYPDPIVIPERSQVDPGLVLPRTYSWLFRDKADIHNILKDVLLNTLLKETSNETL